MRQAYLNSTTKTVCELVARSDAPEHIREMARPLADAPIDTAHDPLSVMRIMQAIEIARWGGKAGLLRRVDSLVRGGG